jgi:hypothetical protein
VRFRALRTALPLVLAIACALVSAPTAAGVAATDPNDTPGRLDLRRVIVLKDGPTSPLRVTLTTWGAWPASLLRRSGPNRVFVGLDTDLDGTRDVRARIVRSGGGLVAELRDSGELVDRVNVARPSQRKLRFTVPGGSPANPSGAVAVAARSRFRGDAACRPCNDRAPDAGWIEVDPGGGGGSFTCTQVIGFSQTREWFLDAPDFEQAVGSDGWQLLWRGGAAVEKWADPNFRGWLEPIQSPCASGATAPDRVVLTISKQVFEDDAAVWVGDIRTAVETIGDKYPGVEQIVLQPVVGGPNHQTCQFGGNPVRASVNHPTIDQAISQVSGGDVVEGPSPEVRTCDDYEDTSGHLTGDAAGPIGAIIAGSYD